MAIPISYNLRNLFVRKTTTLMTAAGIAMTVAVLLAVLGLVHGLESAFASTGDPLRLIILRKGGNAELTSIFTESQYQIAKTFSGIAKGTDGQPLTSLEVVTIITVPNPANPSGTNVTLRGLGARGVMMRRTPILEGRWYQPGLREIVVGKGLFERYEAAHIGQTLHFGKGIWTVVGVMDGQGSATDSEVWGNLSQVGSDFNRGDSYSSGLIQATDVETAARLRQAIENDRRLNVTVLSEKAYFEAQTVSAAPVQFLGYFVCIVMAVGSAFAAMNSMYAAVARRSKEIGTLRILGFTRSSILLSFFIESVLLSLVGGALACVITLPLNAITTGLGNFVTFSETSFKIHIGPQEMAAGLFFSAALGAIGGLLPARQAANKEILVALREG